MDEVKTLLTSEKLKLYYHPDCGACKKQMQMLKLHENHKGVINCSVHKDKCHGIKAYPTWKYGTKKLEGVSTADMILNHFKIKKSKMGKTKIKKRCRFGSNSALKNHPQPYGYTTYGGLGKNGGFRGGNALSCSMNKIDNLQAQMNAYQNYGPFLGVYNGGLKGGSPPMKFGLGGPNQPKKIQPTVQSNIPLPRPYGPESNSLMKGAHWAGSMLPPLDLDWNYTLGQFGKKSKSRRRSMKKRGKKKRYKSYKRGRRRSFGMTTVGTKGWKSSMKKGGGMVPSKLAAAKGNIVNPILLTLPVSSKIPDIGYNINIPKQYTNDQLNSPYPGKFGRRRKSHRKPYRKRKSRRRSYKKRGKKFGKFPSLYQMEGPNNVGFRPPYPMYNENVKFTNSFGSGGNSINWLTGDFYYGPENYMTKVQYTPSNPRSWLGSHKGIKSISKPNGARNYTKLGLSKKTPPHVNFSFGLVRNPYPQNADISGSIALEQPLPPRMNMEEVVVNGNYVSKLKTKFGGKTITLDDKGNISIN